MNELSWAQKIRLFYLCAATHTLTFKQPDSQVEFPTRGTPTNPVICKNAEKQACMKSTEVHCSLAYGKVRCLCKSCKKIVNQDGQPENDIEKDKLPVVLEQSTIGAFDI